MLTKKNAGNEAQEKATEGNQLTDSHISIPFFKRKKSGYHPSARNPLGTAGPEHGGDEEHYQVPPFYSPQAGFNRTEYESRDTGRTSNDTREVSYKSLLRNNIAKREREEALTDPEQDLALEECASLDYSI